MVISSPLFWSATSGLENASGDTFTCKNYVRDGDDIKLFLSSFFPSTGAGMVVDIGGINVIWGLVYSN